MWKLSSCLEHENIYKNTRRLYCDHVHFANCGNVNKRILFMV